MPARNSFHLLIGICCILCVLVTADSSAEKKHTAPPLYKDSSRPVEERIDNLLKQMSLEEKVAQMVGIWTQKNSILNDAGMIDPEKAKKIIPNGIGCFGRPSDNFKRGPREQTIGPEKAVALINNIQHYMVEKTRLGIPVLFHEEGLHGLLAQDATQFPQAIALASTWNPPFIEKVYSIVAREIRVRGVHHALSPVVDVARDPRWGRIEETFGEDPYLVSMMGVAAVNGFQGKKLPLGPDKVLVTLKHMTGHGQPESGTNTAPAVISERMLREVFLPPFEKIIKETPAMSVMASYNEIDGIPSHSNHFLLTEILRNEWKFKGIVVGDYFAVSELMFRHHVAPTLAAAAQLALHAGVDIELPDAIAYQHLPQLVRDGKISEKQIDKAVRRILRAKFVAGLFEKPYADAAAAKRITGNKEGRNYALKAAHQSIILLKNKKNTLPIDIKKCKRIVVIGPNANETPLGEYSGMPKKSISILEGIKTYAGKKVQVDFAQGVHITETRNWYNDSVQLADPEENRRLIKKAVAQVKGADYAIVAIGDNEETCREAWDDNHLGDRASLELVGEQNELLKAIHATGVPTIVVLIHGRPLTINFAAKHIPAILDGWYLGQETGTAVADVLFGAVNPGGKLPVTIPRSVGQLPLFYNYKPTARRGYLFGTTAPLFPFGYGLSYTTFKLENLQLGKKTIAKDDSVDVLVDLINTGKRSGDEVIQLYIKDVVSSVTRPVKELKGFKRVTLAPGKRTTVTFTITPDKLSFYNRKMKRVVEPGDFEIMVGSNSVEVMTTTLQVQ